MEYDLYKKKNCRYCEAPLPGAFLELGAQPLANNLLSKDELAREPFQCPLSLVFCPKCFLVQLSHVVPPEKMFSHYLYVSSTTQTFRDHFAAYARTLKNKLISSIEKPLAVDIGSNDGLLVSCYMKEGFRSLGVDPAKNLADEANQKGFKTLNRFFDANCVEEILKTEGPAHVVSGNNVFAHIDDIASVCRNVHTLLADEGVFVIEFPYLLTMLDTLVFDMIYHEHLSFIGVLPLQSLMRRFGFEIFDIEKVSSHGGSLRVFIGKKNGPYRRQPVVDELIHLEKSRGCDRLPVYQKFADEVMLVKKHFTALMKELKAAGKSIVGYGAPAKASTIANFYNLTPREIDYVVDDNPLKQGMYIPGAKIPIRPSSELLAKPSDYVVIFAWNFAKEILSKLSGLQSRGTKFLIPLIGPEHFHATPPAGSPREAFFL